MVACAVPDPGPISKRINKANTIFKKLKLGSITGANCRIFSRNFFKANIWGYPVYFFRYSLHFISNKKYRLLVIVTNGKEHDCKALL
jgi:hypothetical protein